MAEPEKYLVLGLMSGTSLDGIDLALCEFSFSQENWKFRLIDSQNLPYRPQWKNRLSKAPSLNSRELVWLDHEYGKYTGSVCREFLRHHKEKPLLIASHGHTVFHEPEKGYSLQIGNGNDIAAEAGLPVVFDFRSKDISLGGQGAPLVPIGDKLLFGNYEMCLNLGGFSNISYDHQGERIAFDICPVNIILNETAAKAGYDFDPDGRIGSSGTIHQGLFRRLNEPEYFHLPPPKSLGKEFIDMEFRKIQEQFNLSPEDELRTFYEHISFQIASVVNESGKRNILATGGGAKNKFLIRLLREKCRAEIHLPAEEIIDYKEAIVFAFLGLLRKLGKTNCLASVTGAGSDSCSGVIVE